MPDVTLQHAPQVWPTAGGRIQSTIVCPQCDWSATMRADAGDEIHAFLFNRLRDHVAEKHASVTQ